MGLIIEQASLENKELAFKITNEGLLIKPVSMARQGWKQEFDKALTAKKADQVDREWLDTPLVDDEDWEW